MTTYTATARSNYFEVKDRKAFDVWCTTRRLKCWPAPRLPNAFAIAPADDTDGDGWPARLDEDDDLIAFDITELAPHLASHAVAVLVESGAENLRYVRGFAEAIDATGRTVAISLCDIYEKARAAFGPDAAITCAEY